MKSYQEFTNGGRGSGTTQEAYLSYLTIYFFDKNVAAMVSTHAFSSNRDIVEEAMKLAREQARAVKQYL